MEEEPAERVTTHHRSVGKEGLQRRGWKDEVGGGWVLETRSEVVLKVGMKPMPIHPCQL